MVIECSYGGIEEARAVDDFEAEFDGPGVFK